MKLANNLFPLLSVVILTLSLVAPTLADDNYDSSPMSSKTTSEQKFSFTNGNHVLAKLESSGQYTLVFFHADKQNFIHGTKDNPGKFVELGEGYISYEGSSIELERKGQDSKSEYFIFNVDGALLFIPKSGEVVVIDPFTSNEFELNTKTINDKDGKLWTAISYKTNESERTLVASENGEYRVLELRALDVSTISLDKNSIHISVDKNEIKQYSLHEEELKLSNYSGENNRFEYEAQRSSKETNLPAKADPSSGQPQVDANIEGEKKASWFEEIDIVGLTVKGLIDDVDAKAKQRVITYLLDAETSSVVVAGEPGSGKTTLINAVLADLLNGNVPEALRNHRILKISAASLTGGTPNRGMFEERLEIMKKMSIEEKIIWVVEDIHTLKNKGQHSGQPDGTFDMLGSSMANGTIKILGETTTFDYFRVFEDPRLQRLLPAVVLEDIPEEKLTPYIQNKVRVLYNAEISEELIEEVKVVVDKYDAIGNSISKYIDFIRKIMANRTYRNLNYQFTSEDISEVAVDHYRIDKREQNHASYKEIYQTLMDNLDRELVGQDDVKEALLKATKQVLTNSHDPSKPRYFILLDGPRGLGKTEAGKILEKSLGYPMTRISMGKYETAGLDAIEKLKYEIFQAVKANPHAIIFFDEVDKSPIKIQDGLLDVLDSKTFHVRVGEGSSARTITADISRANFLFASNAGAEFITERKVSRLAPGFTSKPNETSEKIDPAEHRSYLEESGRLSVPFLSRIKKVVAVYPPEKNDFIRVLAIHFDQAIIEISESNKIDITVSDKARAEILEAMNERYFRENRDNRVFEHIDDDIRDKFADARLESEKSKIYDVSLSEEGMAKFSPRSAKCYSFFYQ